MITKLEDFKVYNLAMSLGEEVWSVVNAWGFFEKDTIGKQLVKSTDSIAANLSEGLGRYHFKEIKNFSYYSRGSLFETKTWLCKSFNRKLLTEQQFQKLIMDIDTIGKMLNSYINSLGKINETIPKL
jgi:four helix bundle protein